MPACRRDIEREIRAIQLRASGLEIRAIAELLGVSERSVFNYLQRWRTEKLDENDVHAAALAEYRASVFQRDRARLLCEMLKAVAERAKLKERELRELNRRRTV